ncbi:MAG: hypothetical protein B7Y25_06740 [Alphaproteobacteria bacterium 16-39-46]|nr:MAG: hypothetical protein B7Y25_06740 [Alphaproteobacteria bacterium 16-39-46]OZA42197.1 MAG: hypothetical protein B7X84_06815 [Alphaproteobacteria bacterium 17-39-52]HQS84926.1 tetratricopeptide repeat protein [Alphaproteobacteria bacterium]HQS94375.1 tetratricopeptide repeat protein [Alphaproteobacteria bacterium]
MIRFIFFLLVALTTKVYADQNCDLTLRQIEQDIRNQSQIDLDPENQKITLEQEAFYAKKLRLLTHIIAAQKDVESFLKIYALSQDIRDHILKEFPNISPKEYEDAHSSVGVALSRKKAPADVIVKILLREARLLSGSAGIMLTVLYFYPTEGYKHYDPEILAFFKEQAEEGCPRWEYEYGKILLHGIGTAQDKIEGLKFLEKSTFEESPMELAIYYYDENDFQKFEYYLRKAADQDHPQAFYNLGVLEQNKKNYGESVNLFLKTLELDPEYYEAMLELARMYAEGRGVEVNRTKALDLMKTVVTKSSDEALRNLAQKNIEIIEANENVR